MISRPAIVWAVAGLTALAAGCTSAITAEHYVSLQDIDEARRQAALIVEGEVLETQISEPPRVNVFDNDVLGNTFSEGGVKTRVTLKVTRPIKAPPDLKGPVVFWFYGPRQPIDPGVLLGWSLPSVMRGDRLRVFLVSREGEWWLIAHERWYRQWSTQTPTRRAPQ